MGCSQSKNSEVPPWESTIEASDINIVQDTWTTHVSKQKEAFGVFIFNSFLFQEKEMRRFFPRLVIEDGELTYYADADEVQRHAARVVDGLGLAVECLHDTGRLHYHLRNVGLRHADRGVKADMLPKLYPAIDQALKSVLGERYTQNARRAWRKFFIYITDTMNRTALDAKQAALPGVSK